MQSMKSMEQENWEVSIPQLQYLQATQIAKITN